MFKSLAELHLMKKIKVNSRRYYILWNKKRTRRQEVGELLTDRWKWKVNPGTAKQKTNPVPRTWEGDSAGTRMRVAGWWKSSFPEAKSKREGTFAQRVVDRREAWLLLLWPPSRVGASSGAGAAELHRCAGSELTRPTATASYDCGKANVALTQPYHPALIGSSRGLIQFWAVFSKNLK